MLLRGAVRLINQSRSFEEDIVQLLKVWNQLLLLNNSGSSTKYVGVVLCRKLFKRLSLPTKFVGILQLSMWISSTKFVDFFNFLCGWLQKTAIIPSILTSIKKEGIAIMPEYYKIQPQEFIIMDEAVDAEGNYHYRLSPTEKIGYGELVLV